MFLGNRFSDKTGFLQCGVAQGDPLSMFLFVQAIDPILKILGKKYKLICYADDLLIAVPVYFDTK